MIPREKMLRARRALLNGSDKLSYFKGRGISVETVKAAWVGYDAGRGAFIYPCIAKGGGLLGVHYKTEARDGKGKRRQWWDGYAPNLPSKGHGKKPNDPAKIIPFGLETLRNLEPSSLVVLCGGEEDTLSVRRAGYTSASQPGAGLLEPVYAKEFAGLDVVLLYDAGEEAAARRDALKLEAAGTASVRIACWPEGVPHGTDVNGRLVEDPTGFKGWLQGMIEGAEPLPSAKAEEVEREGEPDQYVNEGGEPDGRNPTQAELLIGCATGAELFHTSEGDSYATIPVAGHRETHPIKSKGLRRWLVRAFFEKYERPPGAQALQDALGLLEARAQFDGAEREVHVRVAEHEGSIYVDLANDSWEAAEIRADGWRVVSDPPVRFRRPRGMLPLPTPARGGTVEELRRFVNVADDDGWRLVVAWLVQALRPRGPYPVLLLQGEQGSAKSTAERLLRALVDPSAAPLRTTPRNEHDLYIAATNAWVIALDNISNLQPWLSDALCRLSTGGGFSTRTLYENREQELFDATRALALNGITDVATRPDLLDRALPVTLPHIPEGERRPEGELWAAFEEARPSILGALFDAVVGALATVQDVRLEGLPRMADFAVWATAAEDALGWEPGSFLRAYAGIREEATETALEADPVAIAVREFMQDREEWAGTAGELWKALNDLVGEDIRHTRAWPGAPNALSGRLKRLAPALRGIGIEYEDTRLPGGSRQRVKHLKKIIGARDRPDRPAQHESPAKGGDDPGTVHVDAGRTRDDGALKTVPEEMPANGQFRAAEDGWDDDLRPDSTEQPRIP